MTVKNYLYISDVKVDLLYEQISSSAVQTTSTEFGVDLKFLKWVGKRETEKHITRTAKLERIVEFIRNSKKVGTVDEPSTYFAGEMDMKWGTFMGAMALYIGETEKTAVLLGGSIKHIIGESPSGSAPGSMLPSIFDTLLKSSEAKKDQSFEPSDSGDPTSQTDVGQALRVARLFRAPVQRLEFLARRYVVESVDGKRVVIGSPYFIALVD